MSERTAALSGNERFFKQEELIVSKTDPKGLLTYANNVFINISGYTEEELLGKPHNILRHPDMPRAVFNLLWDTIQNGKEIFAYVINRCKNGDHYWVLAHVTPSFDSSGKIVGFHSNRRVPDKSIITETISPLYKMLLDEQRRYENIKEGIQASRNLLLSLLNKKGMSYEEFIFSLKK